ncbi:redoxin family protein [Pasteurella skyensis]|uniref:Redoxin family protein n=1 Tax=Phocoenobacter skyensis TaxID=97481 RepID=A0AAJ6N919_9PAST|nr:redoxin family protein [Pasteurella skyensis]MDP8162472.1 redoxin family protein [Pasteurella skyensis]MDP8172437.1 redoxin family protein [Pasteurella skyensis]MDP8177462.1 redoxin family protein [Pasteurella skyensis]MDP8178692.1 redoxin family protein [Pasteurella skyensis]MDP8183018.1 redoxin family protein [Pasteurella skyensis]
MKKYFSLLLLVLSFNLYAKTNLANTPLKDLSGNQVTLKQYKGKSVYIKMWASWCSICLAGLDEIDQLSANPNKDYAVITIVSPGYHGEKETAKFIKWYKGLNYKNITVLLDENAKVVKEAKVRGYPSSVFVDQNLNIQKVIAGHLTISQIDESIKKFAKSH